MKKYIVSFMNRIGTQYDFTTFNNLYDNFGNLEKSINDTLENLRRINNDGSVFMAFGGKYKNADKNGCVAEYYIQEMRTNTLVVKYKVYEVEL